MAQTTSSADAILKSVYAPEVRRQLNDNHKIIKRFVKQNKSDLKWEGKNVIYALHKGRNVGVKATGEGGFLADAGAQSYANLTVPIRDVKGRIEVTVEAIEASRSDKGSFVRILSEEMDRLVDDITRQRNRMLFNNGTGNLALVSGSTSNSTTLSVDTPGSVAGTTNATRFIKAGMVIAGQTQATTVNTIATVSSVDSATQITVTANKTFTDNDSITLGVTNGSTNQGSYGIEPMGLLGIVDGTTYLTTIHGLDRSTAANAFFKSQVNSSVGTLSEDLLYRHIHDNEIVSGELIDVFFCDPSVYREYFKLTQNDRRYTTPDALRKPDAGVDMKAELTFGNLATFVTDKDAPYGILFGCNSKHLFWIPENEGQWEDKIGRGVLRFVPDKTNYQAVWYILENFLSDKGNAHFRDDGVTATVTSGIVAD